MIVLNSTLACACVDPGATSPNTRIRLPFERRISRRPLLQRHPQTVVDGEREAFGHHADDGRGRAIQLYGLTDDIRAAIESALPDVVADHGDRRCARLFIRFEERTPQDRWHAHDAEGGRGHLRDGHRLRRGVTENEVAFERAISAQVFDRTGITPPDREVMQQAPFALTRRRVSHLHFDGAVAVGERQLRTEQIARQVVPSRTDPDGDGEGKASRECQARVLQKHPETQFVVVHDASLLWS